MSAAAAGATRSRSYRIVAFLEARQPDRWPGQIDTARVKNLTGMLQRNGLLQVAVFLKKKGEGDDASRALLALLEGAMKEIAGAEVALTAAYLSKRDLRTSLFLEELSIEVASWMNRLCPGEPEKPARPEIGGGGERS